MKPICNIGFLVPLRDVPLHCGAPQVEVEECLRPQHGGCAEQAAEQRAREAARQHVLQGCYSVVS